MGSEDGDSDEWEGDPESGCEIETYEVSMKIDSSAAGGERSCGRRLGGQKVWLHGFDRSETEHYLK